MLQEFTAWLIELAKKFFLAVWDILTDQFIAVADLVLTALAAIIGAIPLPAFLTTGMQGLFSGLDPGVLYLLGASGLTPALAVYGAGWTFRLVRKFVTVFQW